jgi:hypothetical protein
MSLLIQTPTGVPAHAMPSGKPTKCNMGWSLGCLGAEARGSLESGEDLHGAQCYHLARSARLLQDDGGQVLRTGMTAPE